MAELSLTNSPDQRYLVTADSNHKVTLFAGGGSYKKASSTVEP